jgi:hypothetical protein
MMFSVYYETKPGEDMCILGDGPELGNWKDSEKCTMSWTEGHIWVLDKPMITNKTFFTYKYCLLDTKSGASGYVFEKGIDRILDLCLLEEDHLTYDEQVDRIVTNTALGHKPAQTKSVPKEKGIKYLSLTDEWETLFIRFTIFWPIDKQAEWMVVSTDRTEGAIVKMEKVH